MFAGLDNEALERAQLEVDDALRTCGSDDDQPDAAPDAAPNTAPAGARLGVGYRVPAGAVSADQRSRLVLRRRPNPCQPTPPEDVDAATELPDGTLDLPRFWAVQNLGTPDDCRLAAGEPMRASFVGRLRADKWQLAAHDACVARLRGDRLAGGVLVLPCGFGKTVVAIKVACTLGVRTLVVLGRAFLMDQWVESIRQFVPEAKIGWIQQDRCDVEGADFVVASIKSLATREYPPELLATCGLVLFDEAHHVCAQQLRQAVQRIPARAVLGLSATPDRPDGLGPLLKWSLGSIVYRATRPPEPLAVALLTYTGGEQLHRAGRDGKPVRARMLNDLADDARRTSMLGREIAALYWHGRHTIVLSDRLCQLATLRLELLGRGVPDAQIGWYVGSTSRADRGLSETKNVILSTFTMAREGLDIPRLDTLVMATPVSGVEQAIGRIQRPGGDKQFPLVVDVVDPFDPWDGSARQRDKFYRKSGFVKTAQSRAGLEHEPPFAWGVGDVWRDDD